MTRAIFIFFTDRGFASLQPRPPYCILNALSTRDGGAEYQGHSVTRHYRLAVFSGLQTAIEPAARPPSFTDHMFPRSWRCRTTAPVGHDTRPASLSARQAESLKNDSCHREICFCTYNWIP